MKKITLLILLLTITNVYSQSQNFIGKSYESAVENGILKSRVITNPQINTGSNVFVNVNNPPFSFSPLDSRVRWQFTDPYAIANDVAISGEGLTDVCGWQLNSKRVSVYDTNSNIPLWEYTTSSNVYRNYVSISDSTGYIAVGTQLNFLIFTRGSNTPIFNFDLTTIPDTGIAGPVALTFSGNFLVACVQRNDTSTVMGFNRTSNIPVWKYRMATAIQGVKIGGSDSLLIVNTYYGYAVLNTFTGAKRYAASITGGTQTQQAISGNGDYIATINYNGYVYCYHWTGSAYSLVLSFQEPPGTYYNWMSTVDISNDGQYLATGSLIFVTSSSYDGRVRFFKISDGNTPKWTYAGFGDEVTTVAFARNSKILVASSWGALDNHTDDLVFFKAPIFTNVPVYTVHTPGSLYAAGVSDDGRSVITGGKLVHARNFGYGGTLFNVYIDTSINPTGIKNISNILPDNYQLKQNYPNPFNPTTKIEFDIPKSGLVSLKVYDVSGKEVATLVNQTLSMGKYEVDFSADNYQLSSGVYFYKMTTPNFSKVLKMILIK
jgi:hypothetical protein